MTTPPVPAAGTPFGKEPRTRMNDDHFMHIPDISSHRNVNNNNGPAPVQPCTGTVPDQLSLQSTGRQQSPL